MYLEVDEGFFAHPKTLNLCARLEDPAAALYVLRLWRWACRSAPSGQLGKISAWSIERVVEYERRDGACFAALVDSGFLDLSDDGTYSIHDWMRHTGAAIERMDARAQEMRERRATARAKHKQQSVTSPCCNSDVTVTSLCCHRDDQTRPVQSSPVQSRSDLDLRDVNEIKAVTHTLPETTESAVQTAIAPVVVPAVLPAQVLAPANEPGKPTAYAVYQSFASTRARTFAVSAPFSQPGRSDLDKIAGWLAGISRSDVDRIDDAIELACKHARDGDPGWSDPRMAKTRFLLGAIIASWPDLLEELNGCTPKLKHGKDKENTTLALIDEWK